jgi:queuosine precursor transporter
MFPTLDEKATRKILIALALYLTSLLAANTLGLKIMPFWFGLHLSVGVFMFPFVFLTTDVIGEVYGKRMAKFFVLAGFVSTALFILYSLISLAAPWSPDGMWAHDSFNTIFGLSTRIAIASLVAFIVAEYQDVISFFFFRDRFGTGRFWLRSSLSNIWSQFIDTVLFMVIAFYGVYPNDVLLEIIVSWWLFKVVMGMLYTPLSYLGLWALRR